MAIRESLRSTSSALSVVASTYVVEAWVCFGHRCWRSVFSSGTCSHRWRLQCRCKCCLLCLVHMLPLLCSNVTDGRGHVEYFEGICLSPYEWWSILVSQPFLSELDDTGRSA